MLYDTENLTGTTQDMANADLSVILQHEWERRHTKNARYSLRAFARSIDYDPSSLSKILRGRRRVGNVFIERIGKKLGLSDELIEALKEQRNITATQRKLAMIPKYETLDTDNLEYLSDWHNYAIIELMEVSDFQPNVEWVSRRLNITVEQTTKAVERLQRLNILVVNEDGTWNKVADHDYTTIGGTLFTNYALKLAQEQLMEKAVEAMTEVDLKDRDQSSITFAFRQQDVEDIREEIKKFRRKLDMIVGRKGPKDSVYALTMSLFPLTRKGVENQ